MVCLISGCVTDGPEPVTLYQANDSVRSCEDLSWHMQANQKRILQKVPKQDKLGRNVALGVAGAYLIVPWLFLDFSESERVEIEALQQRNQYLMLIAKRQGCTNLPPTIRFMDEPSAPITFHP
jgi:hypothetical protein